MGAFLGMRGTGDWVSEHRPQNWRETILFLYPNGMAPLTAIMSKLRSEKVDDPEFHWWTKDLASQGGAVTNIYTDSDMGTPYTNTGVEDQVLYIKTEKAVAKEIRAGHKVLLRYSSELLVDVVAKVESVVINESDSRIAVSLLEDDTNTSAYDLSDCDRILIIGNLNAEGAAMPDAIAYDPVKYDNFTEIVRTSLSITRTARKTRLRTVDQYKESKRECLELHSIEMEKSLIWSIPTEKTGANGKPERTTGGIIHFIKTYAPDNVDSFVSNSDYSGDTWLQSGEDWLDEQLEQIFRYGSQEKLGLVGSGALLGIQRLAKNTGQIQLKPRANVYGIAVLEWVTPFGTLFLKTHPLFSYETTNQYSMLIVDAANLVYRYIDDTHFKADKSEAQGGPIAIDGTNEEYLTEFGLELWHPKAFGFLYGFNKTNTA